MVKKLWASLDGYKTYIGVAVGALYSVLIYFNVVSDNALAWTLIALWTGVSFRLAIK